MRRHGLIGRINLLLALEVEGRLILQKIHIGLPEALNRAHIFPITFKGIGIQACFVLQHLRNDVLAEVMAARFILGIFFQILLEEVLIEYIDTHGGQVALGFSRFFLEFFDTARLVRIHDAEAGGFFPRHFDNTDRCLSLVHLMGFQHPGIIHRVDVVTRQNEYILRIG